MLPWFTKYPNQNDEILNLDWVIRQVENLKAAYEAFLAANSLTFADPIVWNITKQYSKNTIVLSPEGDAYLSKKVVDKGIQLNNSDYWLEIFNFAEYVRTANSNLTMHIEQNTTRATDDYAVDDWLLWEDVLYKVTGAIAVDELLTVGTNIVHFTVEEFCRAWQTYMVNTIAQYKNDIDASELQFNNTMTELVNQYKNDIDASEHAFTNQVQNYVNTTTGNLQAQLNAAIAGVTVDSEVINIRVGADGKIYPTAGDAVRGQVSDLKTSLGKDVNLSSWVIGGINVNTGASNAYNTRSKINISPDTNFISVEAGANYYIDAYVWRNDVFIGGWNGTSCATGSDYKLKSIDLVKLIETTEPSAIIIVVQNITNTVIDQSDVPNNIAFFKAHYALTKTVDNLSNIVLFDDSGAWEQGGINVSTGEFQSFSFRIRKKLDRSVSQIFATDGFNFNVFAFDGSTYIGVWQGSDFAKTEKWFTDFLNVAPLRNFGYELYLVGGYSNNASVTPSDGTNITAKNDAIYYTADKIVMPVLSPNVIYQCRNVNTVSIPPESKWYVKSAYDNQYDRVRFDVRKTTDGYYVLIHDDTINNVAVNNDGTAIEETINSNGQTLATLNQYDWGLKYGQQYAGATVPTLGELLKFANAYNLGVTLELHWSLNGSECEDIINICAKYGIIDNLILIFQNGYNYASMNYFKTRVPKISYYIGGTEEWLTSNIDQIKTLKTADNKLYLQPYPIGTVASDALINLAVLNDCNLYCSWVLTESDFDTFAFSHGYSMIEIQGISMIKDYVKKKANALV